MTKNSGGSVYGYLDTPYIDDFLNYAVDEGASYLKNGQLDLDTPQLAKLLAQYVAPVKDGDAPLPPSNAPGALGPCKTGRTAWVPCTSTGRGT